MRLGGRGCPCGRPFTLSEYIEGRIEDVLRLSGKEGPVSVHPVIFHHLLDDAGIAAWQVIQEPSGLRVVLAGLAPGVSTERVRAAVAGALNAAGAGALRVDVQLVEHV